MTKQPLSAQQLLSEVEGLLFDLDGVLLDTEPLYTAATRRVLGERAGEFTWDVKRKLMGRSGLESARVLVSELSLPYSPEEYLEKKRPILLELFAKTPAHRGAERFVRHCKERGIKMAVATSSQRQYFERKTANHEWFSLFDAVVCSSDEEVKAHKPAPDIFLSAAERIGVPASRCAIFEDSVAGVQAAVAAGARTVVALIDQRMDRDEVASAHHVLTGFEDISLSDAPS